MIKQIVILIFGIALTSTLLNELVIAQNNERYFIEATVNTKTVSIGALFHLTITAGAIQGLVQLPGKHVSIHGCQLISYQEKEVSRHHEGYIARQGRYQLRSFVLDQVHIPPLKVAMEWPDGTIETIHSSPITIAINSMQPEPGFNLINPRSPQALPFPWLMVSLYGVGLILSIWLVFVFKPKKRHARVVQPAHITAFKNLNLLGQSTLVAEGNVQEYFILLSKLIRRYLGERYHFPALEMSRLAIVDLLEKQGVEAKRRDMINELLNESDLVKFAMDEVSEKRIAKAHGQARAIIELTKATKDNVD